MCAHVVGHIQLSPREEIRLNYIIHTAVLRTTSAPFQFCFFRPFHLGGPPSFFTFNNAFSRLNFSARNTGNFPFSKSQALGDIFVFEEGALN